MQRHTLGYQCTIPASLTRTPQRALDETIKKAARYLKDLVGPGAFDVEFKPRYQERKTKLIGVVWDLKVVMFFNHKEPLPEHVRHLKTYADIRKQIRQGRGN